MTQLQLVNENLKSFFQNSGRDDNPLYLFAENFYSDIWSEYNYTTELKGIIQDQIKNLRKTPTPQLPNFDDAAASVLDVIDWIFKMASLFSQMNIFNSEMITLPLPFQKNDRSSDLDIKYPHRCAIVIMDNALTRIYLEAISTNKVIITSIPHRFSIMSTNELVQEIEAILLPQTPEAIARRQSLFHKLEHGAEESTSSLMNCIFLHLRMFEYTLRSKDLIDLIGCIYLTFRNRSLFVQTRDKFLKSNTLDFKSQARNSRNILETENAMRELRVTDLSADSVHFAET